MGRLVEDVQDDVAEHLDQIRELFKPEAKITVLVRHPGDEHGRMDFVMTDDDLQQVMNMIARRMAEPSTDAGSTPC